MTRRAKPRRPVVRMLPWRPEYHELFANAGFFMAGPTYTPPARVRVVTSVDGRRSTWSARYRGSDGWIITTNARLEIDEDRQVHLVDRWSTMTCKLGGSIRG